MKIIPDVYDALPQWLQDALFERHHHADLTADPGDVVREEKLEIVYKEADVIKICQIVAQHLTR